MRKNALNQQYQSAIGSLMYLSVSTRPDIAYAVGTLARFSSKPTKEHCTALKRVLCYFKGTTASTRVNFLPIPLVNALLKIAG
jgi:hypothetical protein